MISRQLRNCLRPPVWVNSGVSRRLLVASGGMAEDSSMLRHAKCAETPPEVTLLREIAATKVEGGVRDFILPSDDAEVARSLAEPFKRLLDKGVTHHFLLKICLENESFFAAMRTVGGRVVDTLEVLVSLLALDLEHAIKLYAGWSEYLREVPAKEVLARLNALTNRGIYSGKFLRKIVEILPPLLFAVDAKEMEGTLEVISGFFPEDQLFDMIRTDPIVVLKPWRELELRYEYIYFFMGIEPGQFGSSRQWHEIEIEELMARHELLIKVGKYSIPDADRPSLSMNNPRLSQIVDSSEEDFVRRIAHITMAEYNMFKKARKKAQSAVEEERESRERPYTPIKASMRRKYYEAKKKVDDSYVSEFDNTLG